MADTNAALTALQDAKTKADELPVDTPDLQDLKNRIAAAIEEATQLAGYRQGHQGCHRERIPLAVLVQMVRGHSNRDSETVAADVAIEVEKAGTPYIELSQSAGTNNENLPMNTGGKAEKVTSTTLNYPIYNHRATHNLPSIRM